MKKINGIEQSIIQSQPFDFLNKEIRFIHLLIQKTFIMIKGVNELITFPNVRGGKLGL